MHYTTNRDIKQIETSFTTICSGSDTKGSDVAHTSLPLLEKTAFCYLSVASRLNINLLATRTLFITICSDIVHATANLLEIRPLVDFHRLAR